MTTVPLRDVVSVRGGGTPRKSVPSYFGGDVPWVTPKDMKRPVIGSSEITLTPDGVKNSPAKVVPAGVVLVVVRSGVLKHNLPVALTTQPVAVNQDMKALIPTYRLDAAYLARLLKSLQPRVLRWVRATTADNFPIDKLLDLEIKLPPIEEQRRIAVILDHADALRAKRRQTLAHLDTLTRSIFSEMFCSDIANGDRVELQSLTALVTKGTTPTSVGLQFTHEGVPFVRVQNLQQGTVRFGSEDLFIGADAHKVLRRSVIRPEDLLISIAGTIGRVSIVPRDAPEMNCNQAVAIVRPSDPAIGPWLMTWLNSRDAKRQIRLSSVTATISNLSLSQIGKLKVPVVPEDAIRRFARRWDAANAQHTAVLAAQGVDDELFDSLQSRAFRGEL